MQSCSWPTRPRPTASRRHENAAQAGDRNGHSQLAGSGLGGCEMRHEATDQNAAPADDSTRYHAEPAEALNQRLGSQHSKE
jgi:hypothetical protein